MNIEALDINLIQKQEISESEIKKAEENKVSSETSKYSWLNEFMSLISGKPDATSYLSDVASGLDFTRTGAGWRSGSCSFLTGVDSLGTNSVTGRYSNLKSFHMDTANTYSTTKANLKVTLEKQLTEAKNKLSLLEAEKQAKQNDLDAGFDSTTQRRLSSKAREDLQNTIKSYENQIIIQKTTISNIEAKLTRVQE